MHRALQVTEILSIIFGYCYHSSFWNDVDRARALSDLAALARTCRTFKEPALDILWSELDDPSPLPRCLPEISTYRETIENWTTTRETYMFTRPPEQAEWDILYSYTRRVWTIHDLNGGLDWSSIKTSTNVTSINPLFPNLRSLHCKPGKETIPLLLLPFPSLIYLNIGLSLREDLRRLKDPLKSLTKTSPNVKRVNIQGCMPEPAFNGIVSNSLCGWSNIQSVDCPEIPLDASAFAHLSRMPALTRMWFMLSSEFHPIIPSDSLCFANLENLRLFSRPLAPISRFLYWARLPVIQDFVVSINACPSKDDLTFFMEGVRTSGMGHTIQKFEVVQIHDAPDTLARYPGGPTLCFDDLRPCLVFDKLRDMNLDLQWDVSLSDDELLALVSAWPRVEKLLINADWGWNTPGGITLTGFASLLQTRPSLTSVAFAFNTRDVNVPTRQCRGRFHLIPFYINVVDSDIEDAAVPAISEFLSGILSRFSLISWDGWTFMLENPDMELYQERWEAVGKCAAQSGSTAVVRDMFEAFLSEYA